MKLFKTPQAINLWKIFSFLILFMVIDTVTAFFRTRNCIDTKIL